jgi:hypothetical protein
MQFQNDLVLREKKEQEERKRRQEQEEENKYDIGIIKSYKVGSRGKSSANVTKPTSKRNLNLLNGKKRVSGTPINIDQSKKRISQPMGFGKKSSAVDNLDPGVASKARRSTVFVGQNKNEFVKTITGDVKNPNPD